MTDLVVSEASEVIPGDLFDENAAEWQNASHRCDEIVKELNETGDDSRIFTAIQTVNIFEKVAAKTKAKLLVGYAVWYKKQNPSGNFFDWYAERTGADKNTVQKHVAVGELLSDPDVPDDVKEQPYKNLISVARAKSSGYEFDEDDWDEISASGRESDVNKVVAKVKNKPPRKGSLTIVVWRDGTIMGKMDGEQANLGWLNYADLDNTDLTPLQRKIVRVGTSRIRENAGGIGSTGE